MFQHAVFDTGCGRKVMANFNGKSDDIYKWLNHQIWGTPFADKPDILIGVRGLLFAQGSTGKEDEPEPRVTKTGADSWLISCCD